MVDGKIPHDYEIIRQIASICTRLPGEDNPALPATREEKYHVTIMANLATLLKSINAAGDLIEKQTIAFEHKSRGASRNVFHL